MKTIYTETEIYYRNLAISHLKKNYRICKYEIVSIDCTKNKADLVIDAIIGPMKLKTMLVTINRYKDKYKGHHIKFRELLI